MIRVTPLRFTLSTRTMSSQTAKGLRGILQKNPDDVVITFAKRTATGKTKKGQFKDIPVDEMMQALLKVRDITSRPIQPNSPVTRTTGHPREDRP